MHKNFKKFNLYEAGHRGVAILLPSLLICGLQNKVTRQPHLHAPTHIIFANVDQYVWWYMASPGHNVMFEKHYSDVIMSMMASQITSISTVCSAICSGRDQRKHQSWASLVLVRESMDCHHKGPVKQKMFPFDDKIMCFRLLTQCGIRHTVVDYQLHSPVVMQILS